jgi:hypothetical protein
MSRRAPATGIYQAIIGQLHARIRRLGVPMWVCDDRAGLQDGYTAKLLHPDTPSGRQARWETLQLLIDAMYPEGFVLTIRPRRGETKPFQKNPNKITDQRVRSVLMALGRQGGIKSGEARAKLPPEQRKKLGAAARKVRWAHKRKLRARN